MCSSDLIPFPFPFYFHSFSSSLPPPSEASPFLSPTLTYFQISMTGDKSNELELLIVKIKGEIDGSGQK